MLRVRRLESRFPLRAPRAAALYPPITQEGEAGRWLDAIQRIPRDCVIGGVKDAIIARRGKEARNIAKVAAARRLLTLVFYGMRDGQIRCLSQPPAGPAATQAAQAA